MREGACVNVPDDEQAMVLRGGVVNDGTWVIRLN